MSLLMDALRKAEEAKKQAETDARAQLLHSDLETTEENSAELSEVDGGGDDQEKLVSSDTDISLEFENYPESTVANASTVQRDQGDVTVDLKPTEAGNNGAESVLPDQDLELETIPFDENIPTLTAEGPGTAQTLSMEPVEEIDYPTREQSAEPQLTVQNPVPADEQTPLSSGTPSTESSSEPPTVDQELDSLLEKVEVEADVEDLTLTETQNTDHEISGHDQASNAPDLSVRTRQNLRAESGPAKEQTEKSELRSNTARPVTNEKSHFSAQSIFAAKANARKAKRQRFQIAAAMMMALAVGSGFAYNWWSSNSTTPQFPASTDYLVSEGSVNSTDTVPLSPTDVTTGLQPGAQTTAADSPTQTPDLQPALPAQQEPLTTATVGVASDQLNSELASVSTPAPAEPSLAAVSAPTNDQLPQAQVDAAAVERPRNFINFNRSSGETTVIDSSLEKAYQAYQTGNLDAAQRFYQAALISEPLNRNALLGLAAIAAGKNETIVALDLYSKLLNRDPTDPIARAGILDLRPTGNALQQERELKNLITAHPGIAPLSYALGNLYASQQLWSQAQQAYFEALRQAKNSSLEPGEVNPDYAYNLAISLEHLNQSGPARNYYQEALQYSAYHPASFDVEQVRNRLENLDGGLLQ